ncbi:MAG TPA: Mur ligase domain-containing protein, partial [Chitinophagaceae bacterium]|nr:Mur ligase domain-containing protein [Chitinophagaceae bacterium]
MATSLTSFKKPFFIGIAGAGMSALAQYLHGIGMEVSGSDRFFLAGEENETRTKLEAEGIRCFPQNGEGISNSIDLVVASTAVEDSVPEMQKAKQLGIPVIRRSALLAMIVKSKKTIAIGGTSGKSTTAAMLFVILEKAGWQPSIITGAGLINLMREEKIGNAKVGSGEWLVIEADESDGSITQYHPAVGVLLNIDKDHQEIDALKNLFTQFKNNSEKFIVNRTHELAASLSQNEKNDFSTDTKIPAGLVAKDFKQLGFTIQ